MVKQGGREIVTVNIYKEHHDILKAEAEEKKRGVTEYINEKLSYAIEKDRFLKRIAPALSLDSLQDNHILIKDTARKALVYVYVVDSELRCELDKSTDCEHTHFAWALPEVARIDLKKPPTAPKR